jgi:hypothetical protein
VDDRINTVTDQAQPLGPEGDALTGPMGASV